MIGMKRVLVFLVVATTLGAIGCGNKETSAPAAPEVAASEATPEVAAQPAAVEAPGDGRVPMPEYEVPTLDGEKVRLSGKSDKVRLVNVWATWCGPCRREIPDLVQIQKEHGAEGLEVVGVSIDYEGTKDQIRDFVTKREVNYTIALDPDGRIAELLSTAVVPTTALVDRDGMIVWIHKGQLHADSPDLADWLKKTL